MCGCHPLGRWVRLVVAVLLGASALGGAIAGAQPGPPQRMLVMPFDTSGEARGWWLGEGSSHLVAEYLRAFGLEALWRDDRRRAFARLQVPGVASLSHGTIIRIGQLLGATAVIVGSVTLEDEEIIVKARSIRLDTGRLQTEVQERGALDDLLAVHDRLARRLLPTGVTPDDRPLSQQPPLAAFENFIKGLLADSHAAQVGLLEKAIALHPEYDRARLELWRAHHEADEHQKALSTALAVPDGSTLANRAQFAAAVSEIELLEYDDAFKRLQFVSQVTGAPEAYNNLGIIQLRRGATPETGLATYWFSKASQADPAEPDYCFNLGYAYWFEQDPRAAVYWLREAVRRDTTDGGAHFLLGSALHATGSSTEGEREFELARRLSSEYEKPDARPPAERVDRGLERLKDDLQAPGAFRADLTLQATGLRDHRELAQFHLDRGRRFFERESDREAVAELLRSLYLSPYEAEAHLLLGRVYLRSGRLREGVDALKVALWSQPSAEAHVALAQAYVQAREFELARTEAEKALALDPESPAARDVLKDLGGTR